MVDYSDMTTAQMFELYTSLYGNPRETYQTTAKYTDPQAEQREAMYASKNRQKPVSKPSALQKALGMNDTQFASILQRYRDNPDNGLQSLEMAYGFGGNPNNPGRPVVGYNPKTKQFEVLEG